MKIYSSDDILILDVEVDDTSYRQRIIKGDNNVTLRYALAGHVEIPVGAYIDFEGERYTLLRPENLKLVHRRNFEYTVLFESPQAKARIWKFRNPVDGRVKFPLTAKPVEHLRMFVDNMNRRDSGWSVGTCIDGVEKLINYDHDYCWDALQKQAETFETEFEIAGKVVSLRRVESDKSNPLTLCYGCGRGFKPNVGRANVGDTPPVEILLVQGGSRNIDRSTYGNADLLLPALQTLAYDGEHFEDEEGFASANARTYIVDEYGLSLRRADRQMTLQTEDSFDCTHIYPSRVGTVSSVMAVDEANNFYDIVDETIPEELNFEECLLGDEPMTLIFQSGMLAGDSREFEVRYYHTSVNGKAARRFEIVPQEIDGMTMPGGSFVPRVGDTYAVFHCALPAAYVRDDATKSGASWDMFREAVRYMFDHEDVEFSFSGELDGLWAKRDWLNIGGRIRLGGYIQFHDESFQPQGILIRITGIKEYVNDPHSPILTLSNESVGGGFSTEMKRLKGEEVAVEQNHRSALQYTKRRFRDAKETLSMLEAALLSNFTESISPLSVQTMAMLVGDESLQFQFVDSMTHPRVVAHNVVFDTERQVLTVPAGIIQHMTLGIDTISPDHKVEEYRFWSLPEFRTPPLTDAEKKYYLYAKVSASERTGEFRISETAIPMNAEADAYYLLMGILNSAYDGERSFVTLYGFSEVLPGRITTDRIASSDGESYFDLLNDALKLHDKLQYNVNGDGQLCIVGGISQNSGGFESPIGVYRGVFAKDAVYYNGDRVQYDIGGGLLSTYTYIGTEPSAGHLPTETQYWRVEAAGVKGDTGAPGKDGPYTDFKYAKNTSATQAPALADTDRNPAGWSDVPPALGAGEHLWMTQAEITAGNVLNGTWSAPRRLTGLDGKGIPGDPGKDGRTTYFHIRYADVANPTAEQMKTTPAAYIGTYVDFTAADSDNPDDYRWVRFQGENGRDGIPGTNGEDGKTYYLHIRFSNDGGQTFAADKGLRKVTSGSLRLLGSGGFRFTNHNIGEVEGDYLGYYVDDVEADSPDVFRYSWKRIKGQDGEPGHFIEYRYSKNGSTTVPPELDKALLEPAGWTTAMPTVGPLEYLWLTMAEKTGDKTQLVTPWSTPVRITPQDGKDGESPVVLYRGAYDKDKTYYGNRYRLDAVKYNGTHYITRIDAGEFKGIPPTAENELNADKWNPFGAELESVATNLLLAENASIGDWFISHGMIVSTLQEEGAYRITLDAKNGEITLVSQKTGGEYSLDSDTSNIKLSAASGIIEARNKNGVAYMSASGIFANRAGTQALAPSTGRTWRAAMVGHGFANVNKSDWDIDKLGTMVMGVFGDALNSGTAMAVGGFFDKLYAHGLILHRKAISGEKQTVYLDYHDTMVVGYTSDVATVYLPADPYEGQVVFVKQWWTGSMRFKTRTGHSIYDDNSENDNYDFGCGQGGMFVFTIGYITSGSTQTKKEVWLVSRWKF